MMLGSPTTRVLARACLLAAAGWGFELGCGARSALDLPLGAQGAGLDGSTTGDGTMGSGGGRDSGGSGPGTDGSGPPGSGSGSSSGSGSGSSPIGSGCGGSSGGTPPSCAGGGPGLTNCGACNETCCASYGLPPQTYFRTYTNGGSGAAAANEADPATISSLLLDRYLVTIGRFRQFVAAWSAGYTPAVGSGIHTQLNGGQGLAVAGVPGTYETGWGEGDGGFLDPTDTTLGQCGADSTWTPTPGSADDEARPINCVSWWEAYAFCIWDGGFLPSEAEWELAAAAGDQQREYPWGTTDPGTANDYAIFGYGTAASPECYFPMGGACIGAANVAPVGTAAQGAGLYGQIDMAGNLGEWTLDWFAPYEDPCVDCAQLTAQSFRSIRGGSFDQVLVDLAPWTRAGRYPAGRTGEVGFRCARAP